MTRAELAEEVLIALDDRCKARTPVFGRCILRQLHLERHKNVILEEFDDLVPYFPGSRVAFS